MKVTNKTVDVLVDGGAASAGPPLGPALGPLGVNTGQVVAEINEKTKDFKGMKIPVKVIVDDATRSFEVKVGSPPTSALIKKELGIEKGTKDASPVGNLSFAQLLKIASAKKDSLLAKDIKPAVKEVVGVCQSVGVTVEGRKAKELTKEIDSGVFDDVISGKTDVIPERGFIEEEEELVIMTEEEAEKEAGIIKEEKVEAAPEKEAAPSEEKTAEKKKGKERPEEKKKGK